PVVAGGDLSHDGAVRVQRLHGRAVHGESVVGVGDGPSDEAVRRQREGDGGVVGEYGLVERVLPRVRAVGVLDAHRRAGAEFTLHGGVEVAVGEVDTAVLAQRHREVDRVAVTAVEVGVAVLDDEAVVGGAGVDRTVGDVEVVPERVHRRVRLVRVRNAGVGVG